MEITDAMWETIKQSAVWDSVAQLYGEDSTKKQFAQLFDDLQPAFIQEFANAYDQGLGHGMEQSYEEGFDQGYAVGYDDCKADLENYHS